MCKYQQYILFTFALFSLPIVLIDFYRWYSRGVTTGGLDGAVPWDPQALGTPWTLANKP